MKRRSIGTGQRRRPELLPNEGREGVGRQDLHPGGRCGWGRDAGADRLEGDDRSVRAQLVVTQITGLMSSLWVTEDSELLVDSREAVIRLYGAAMQQLITPSGDS